MVVFGSSAHLLPPSGSVSFSTLCKGRAHYQLGIAFYLLFPPPPYLSLFLTSLSITYTKTFRYFFGSVLIFGAPGSENLEMNGWQKNLLRSLNALKHPRLVSSFSLLVS